MAENAEPIIALMEKIRSDSARTALSPAVELASVLAAGEDPSRLIADTVRDESKTYPRPAPLDTFTQPSFSMSASDLAKAIASMAGNPAYADIRPATASSNGERYLYSADHLADGHAAGLAEWTSVGERENP